MTLLNKTGTSNNRKWSCRRVNLALWYDL